ncbi:G2/mitotic-specific cyclin [Podila epigama]|nr:G2/mitotic-specific cyclin [Podila epigama]
MSLQQREREMNNASKAKTIFEKYDGTGPRISKAGLSRPITRNMKENIGPKVPASLLSSMVVGSDGAVSSSKNPSNDSSKGAPKTVSETVLQRSSATSSSYFSRPTAQNASAALQRTALTNISENKHIIPGVNNTRATSPRPTNDATNKIGRKSIAVNKNNLVARVAELGHIQNQSLPTCNSIMPAEKRSPRRSDLVTTVKQQQQRQRVVRLKQSQQPRNQQQQDLHKHEKQKEQQLQQQQQNLQQQQQQQLQHYEQQHNQNYQQQLQNNQQVLREEQQHHTHQQQQREEQTQMLSVIGTTHHSRSDTVRVVATVKSTSGNAAASNANDATVVGDSTSKSLKRKSMTSGSQLMKRPRDAAPGQRRRESAKAFQTEEEYYLNEEYASQVLANARQRESDLALPRSYIESNSGGQDWRTTRAEVVNLLCSLSVRMQCSLECTFLSVHLFDQVVARKSISLGYTLSERRMNLYGVLCMVIAAKYEDGLQSYAELEFAQQVLVNYNIRLNMDYLKTTEWDILATVDFQLLWPGPMMFLRRCSRADDVDPNTRLIGKYLLEMMLYKDTFLEYPPSLKAAAAMYVARLMLKKKDWTTLMVEYSGYEEKQLRRISIQLLQFLSEDNLSQTAVYMAYDTKANMQISPYASSWAKKTLPTFAQD